MYIVLCMYALVVDGMLVIANLGVAMRRNFGGVSLNFDLNENQLFFA